MEDNGEEHNVYEKAILTVGKILEPYSTNNEFFAYGFGAFPIGDITENVSHCFPLQDNEKIIGLKKLLEIYQNTLNNI